MSGIRYASGRNRLIGFGQKLTSIAALDPARYEGAALYYEGEFLYSDGEQWKIPTETRPIVRPSALVPTNSAEQAQLRLTEFLSPLGLQQTSVVFEVSLSGDFANDRLFQRVSTDPNASVYDILYPDDGIAPGQAFFWRGLYTATGGQQSDWSSAYRQVYPDLITPPVPLTRPFAITATLEISPYESIFGLTYLRSEFEIYDDAGEAVVANVTTTTGGLVRTPDGLSPNTNYSWRARHVGQVGLSGDVVASRWTTLRPFVNAVNSLILEYDLSKGTSGTTINLPLNLQNPGDGLPFTLDVTIDWGDGTSERVTTAGVKSHSYTLAALPSPVVTVVVTGTLVHWGSNLWTSVDQSKLTRVSFIGFGMGLRSLYMGFTTAPNLAYLPESLPDSVTDLMLCFYNNKSFNLPQIGSWDVSRVRTLESMFHGCDAFNQPLDRWRPARCSNFRYMFTRCPLFDQDIGAWTTAEATTMEGMFAEARSFNNGGSPSINDWNTAKLTNAVGMFSGAWAFNQPIGNWNTANLTTVTSQSWPFGMFYDARAFNQNIGNWNVARLTSFYLMFAEAIAFNNGGSPAIGTWNTAQVTNFQQVFYNARAFNQPIGSWNVSAGTTFYLMMGGALAFNQNIGPWRFLAASQLSYLLYDCRAFNNGGSAEIGTWVFPLARSVGGMFFNCQAFNQPIGTWDVSGIENFYWDQSSGQFMVGMFQSATAFDQDLSAWRPRAARRMDNMFTSATGFNNGGSPGINDWDVSKVEIFSGMFSRASRFNQPIGGWNTGAGQNFSQMFYTATAFNQDLSAWPMGNARTTAWMFGRASAFNNGGNPGINSWDVSRVTDMSGMFGRATVFNQPIGNWTVAAVERFWTLTNLGELRLGFLEATAFDQDLGAWRLRSLGTDLTNFGAPALSRVNYSRLLTGWANQMRANNGPFAIALNVSNLSYDGTLHTPGAAYETAIAGRAALVGANRLTVTGATDAAANGDYPFGARYQNAAGWYFTNSSVRWTLFDPLGNAQAAGDIPTGANNTPGNVTSWSGVLNGASVKRTGAAWTITGDLLA